MKDMFQIDGKTDEELLEEYTVTVDGRAFIPARLLDAIGERRAKLANRKPGDPGTKENPIFRNGKAFIYSSKNRLILWEDYTGSIPATDESHEVEVFRLEASAKPSEAQKAMIQKAKSMPVNATPDCPIIPSQRLDSLTRFKAARPLPVR